MIGANSRADNSALGSIELSRRRILIDGVPRLVFAGEVHYFRLARDVWADRLRMLQANGIDTVATYIPWVWHELTDGTVDLTGQTDPRRDFVSFVDLCAEHGLNVIVRPGPFCMAELKNEGLPYRLYKPPFVQPTTWRGEPTKTRTRDYLAPDFLDAVRQWYAEVMPFIASRLKTLGGPVIAVQLDNEIGMLQWVSNCPDLSDHACEDMRGWALKRYGAEVASQRVGADAASSAAWAAALRSPTGSALALHHDLGLFMRDRFRRYVVALRQLAESHGVSGVPFLVNIHGTGGGRGLQFPIGISQLYESYRNEPGMTSGSDLYLGDLTVSNVADLYLANAFMQAVHGPDQPLTSLEFEVGNGNYGDDLGQLYTPEAAELKARLCVAQGNRLLNFYIHSGGENPALESVGDGIDRIAFTGQRHGFAAPVDPEGKPDATFDALTRVVKSLQGLEELLADSEQQFDDFAIGFVPDHYLTEYRFDASSARREQIADLERFRGRGPRDVLARALLLCGFSFPAVDLQSQTPRTGALVLATGRTLGRDVQERLVQYVRSGGKLLLVGLLPDTDHDGAPCTVLADAIGLRSAGRVLDEMTEKGNYWPTVRSHGWAKPRPEVRVSVAQLLESSDGRNLNPFLTEIESGKPCAVTVQHGAGSVTVLGCDYPADLSFYRELMGKLGISPICELKANGPGVVLIPTRHGASRYLLQVLNVAPHAVAFALRLYGKRAFGGKRITIPARAGVILPFSRDVEAGALNSVTTTLAGSTIVSSTAELLRETKCSITLRPSRGHKDLVLLRTDRRVECLHGQVQRKNGLVRVAFDGAKLRCNAVTIKLTSRIRSRI